MSHDESESESEAATPPVGRRTFLSTTTSLAMLGGMAAGYGTFATLAAEFLYPAHERASGWVFVAVVERMKPGDSLQFRTPAGARAAIARRAGTGDVSDFIALSATCPHLGCQVHWEADRNRFFCPCHNGTFDPTGRATGGPPAQAGQALGRYPLKIDNGLLFIQVPLDELALGDAPAASALPDEQEG